MEPSGALHTANGSAAEPAGLHRGTGVAGWSADEPAESGIVAEPISAADPAAVLARVVRAVLARSRRSRLNLLLGDGETL